MRFLVKYDEGSQELVCLDQTNIPLFCKKCLRDSNKECQKHYNKILTNNISGIHACPYGMHSYSIRNTVYTSLILKNDKYGQAKKNIESKNQKITDFNNFNENQLENLIADIEDIEINNIIFGDCIHDLRNIGSYFHALTDKIEGDYVSLVEADDNIKALLLLYDIVNYRLDVLEGIKNVNNRRILQKVHPQIRKLVILTSFQAKNKDIKIRVDSEQENMVYLSKNIYLALFLLIENAVKHSPFNSTIEIDFDETAEYTEIMICNRGPYISDEELPRLVERGYRGINAISKGSGLGLTLAKSILDDNNSDFKVEKVHINSQETLFKVIFKVYTYKPR